MRIGKMRHKASIMKSTPSQNSVGEQVYVLDLFLNIGCSVEFERTLESGSKFNSGWSNQLIITTRYNEKMMGVITSRNEYKIQWQGNTYKLVNYEMWNNKQDYIKFYVLLEKA